MIPTWLVWPFLSTVLLSSAPVTREFVWVTKLRHCDLVAQCTVLSAETELMLSSEMLPWLSTNRPEDLTEITTVRSVIGEVFWGQAEEDTLEFIVPVSVASFANDYQPGQRMVVGLVWDREILGGLYRLYSDGARFVLSNAVWESREGRGVLENLDGLRTSMAALAPERVIDDADAVVVGRVRQVRFEEIQTNDGREATVMCIAMESVETVSGEVVPREVTVKQITAGDYWPAWRDPAPLRQEIRAGSDYCVLLKRYEDIYAVVRGINGIWEIRKGHLYFAGRVPVRATVDGLRTLMETSK